jgi:hypothetical protein
VDLHPRIGNRYRRVNRDADAAAEALPRSAWLNLNMSPELISAREPLRTLLRRRRRRLVLEVTEHTAIADYPAFRAAMAKLGRDGVIDSCEIDVAHTVGSAVSRGPPPAGARRPHPGHR